MTLDEVFYSLRSWWLLHFIFGSMVGSTFSLRYKTKIRHVTLRFDKKQMIRISLRFLTKDPTFRYDLR